MTLSYVGSSTFLLIIVIVCSLNKIDCFVLRTTTLLRSFSCPSRNKNIRFVANNDIHRIFVRRQVLPHFKSTYFFFNFKQFIKYIRSKIAGFLKGTKCKNFAKVTIQI